ncbi:MAG: hypothetical protein QXZ17_12630 [Nitrososphaerota archaeon]
MKFAELEEPPGGYTNNSDSFFLVLGITNTNVTPPTGTGVTFSNSGALQDQIGATVDFFKVVAVIVNSWSLPMPVWNGSSIVNENYTLYTSAAAIYSKSIMLIPPGYKFSNFGIAIGFWLTAEEVEKMIMGQGPFNMERLRGKGEIKI